jgi:hyperosmotically inducible periplasmic protein
MTRWILMGVAVVLAAYPALAAAQTTTTDKIEKKTEKAADKIEQKAEKAGEKARSAADKAGTASKDAWVTSKTKIAFFADERVSGRRINVETQNGVVSLRGKVATAEEKSAAEDIAKGIEGVKSVKNSLQIVAEPARKAVDAKDADLTKAVKDRLVRDEQTKKAGIEVRADNGVVTLTGEAPTIRASARASELARGVPGVKAVKNELREKS